MNSIITADWIIRLSQLLVHIAFIMYYFYIHLSTFWNIHCVPFIFLSIFGPKPHYFNYRAFIIWEVNSAFITLEIFSLAIFLPFFSKIKFKIIWQNSNPPTWKKPPTQTLARIYLEMHSFGKDCHLYKESFWNMVCFPVINFLLCLQFCFFFSSFLHLGLASFLILLFLFNSLFLFVCVLNVNAFLFH